MARRPIYIHYSSRPEEPRIPSHTVHFMSGGTGPFGVYAYQEDARHKTFGADRPYAFNLAAVDRVTHTDRYNDRDLARDLTALRDAVDVDHVLKLWDKLVAKGRARNVERPFTTLWYVVTHVTRSTDPDDQPRIDQSGCADPELTRQLLVGLGHTVVDDRLGILYSSEPEQAVFLTDDSFEVLSREDNVSWLERAAPKANPSRRVHLRTLQQNPAWADKVLVSAYDELLANGQIRAAWVPRLTDLHLYRGKQISGRFHEFGCGTYGCVYPTMDDKVVLKVTTDSTEMEFATTLSAKLVAPVCVEYYVAFETDQTHKKSTINLLWRESAFDVGKLAEAAEAGWGTGEIAVELVAKQWDHAQSALKSLWGGDGKDDRLLAAWEESLETMADQDDVPILKPVGAGMLKIYREQHVFFGDVHIGNLGCVDRDGELPWVITDPGNIVVIDQ